MGHHQQKLGEEEEEEKEEVYRTLVAPCSVLDSAVFQRIMRGSENDSKHKKSITVKPCSSAFSNMQRLLFCAPLL